MPAPKASRSSARFPSRLAGPALALVLLASPSLGWAEDGASGAAVSSLATTTDGELLKVQGGDLYASRDQGRSWIELALPAEATGRIDEVAVAAGPDEALYASGPDVGVFQSKDDGKSWTNVGGTLPSLHVTAFAPHATEASTLYAFIPEKGIYRSRDAGGEWTMMARGPAPREGALLDQMDAVVDNVRQFLHTDMEGSMESGWLYAATSEGLRVTMDCFCLWRETGEFPGTVEAVAADPTHPEDVYAAAGAELFKSADGGRTFSTAAAPETPVTAMTVQAGGLVYAGTEDGAVLVSRDKAAGWTRADE
ncbi:WD40/YVTN/BNR-like repeat-containing protein [Consotaella salsifontis]|uniref:Photosynthesis system II assembly factor Ycf48/Hcf136-like domain-containing protein n=1 Tax=Consotaella salsifontis TaxID=1365950 RepID=A0A1T4RMK5_9HYPH|nr:hypothetical protein [Consotaella salsifontis]SKA17230.1 hypothetical protein SAMN05428963_10799 [Consotaella salsifontis]